MSLVPVNRAAAPALIALMALASAAFMPAGTARAHHHDQHADESAPRHGGDGEPARAATGKGAQAATPAAASGPLAEAPSNDLSSVSSSLAEPAALPSLHANPKIANEFVLTNELSNEMKAIVKDAAGPSDPAALRRPATGPVPGPGPALGAPADSLGNAAPSAGDPLAARPGPPAEDMRFDIAPPRAEIDAARPPRPAIPPIGIFGGLVALALIGLGSGFVLSRRLRPSPPPGADETPPTPGL